MANFYKQHYKKIRTIIFIILGLPIVLFVIYVQIRVGVPEQPEAEKIDEYITWLKSPIRVRRIKACEFFIKLGPIASRAKEDIHPLLSDPEESVRGDALLALNSIGRYPEYAGDYLFALDDDFWRVRKAAAFALGNLGIDGEIALKKLEELAKTDPYHDNSNWPELTYPVRSSAVEAIAKIKNATNESGH